MRAARSRSSSPHVARATLPEARVTDPRPEVAEAVGAFFLVFAACGAIMVNWMTGQLGHTGIALTFAFVITILVYALGHVCGAHFNPAITLGFALSGHFPWRRVPSYIVAQVAGATAAAFLLRGLLGDVANVGATTVAPMITPPAAFLIEVFATFLLALVIIGVATDARAQPGAAGLAIGFAVGTGALFAGPLTGGSMNPARSLGPAIASGTWTHAWIYVVAPIVGAVAAMALYEYLRPARFGIDAKEPLGALGPIPGLRGERASDPVALHEVVE